MQNQVFNGLALIAAAIVLACLGTDTSLTTYQIKLLK